MRQTVVVRRRRLADGELVPCPIVEVRIEIRRAISYDQGSS